jgi:hypothetical protein
VDLARRRAGDFGDVFGPARPQGTLCWVGLFGQPLRRGKLARPMPSNGCAFSDCSWDSCAMDTRFVGVWVCWCDVHAKPGEIAVGVLQGC